MSNEYVTIKDLANELGMDRSRARRYILELGIRPEKRRTADSRNQPTLTVSPEEAQLIRNTRREQGFQDTRVVSVSDIGYFYLIQIVPELDPQRIKLGFATNVDNRLQEHRTVAPTAEILRAWPSKRSWESTIIDALGAVGGKLILNEVFEFEDLNTLLSQAENLFSLLPDPSAKIPLSEKSPYSSANAGEDEVGNNGHIKAAQPDQY